jgi:hypothetical protein
MTRGTTVAIGAAFISLCANQSSAQIAPGNTVQVTGPVFTGGYTDRQTSIPTVTNTAYTSGNCMGGFNSVTFQGGGPLNFLNGVRVASQSGGTESVTVYVFDSNPASSTCTDRVAFALATADTDKLVMVPFSLTLAAPTGATQSFASNPNLARIPASGATALYYGLVSGTTFTNAGTTNDIHVEFQVIEQHQ